MGGALLSVRRQPGRLELRESLKGGTGLVITLLTLPIPKLEMESDQAAPVPQCELKEFLNLVGVGVARCNANHLADTRSE